MTTTLFTSSDRETIRATFSAPRWSPIEFIATEGAEIACVRSSYASSADEPSFVVCHEAAGYVLWRGHKVVSAGETLSAALSGLPNH
jgi:hypothetical protein